MRIAITNEKGLGILGFDYNGCYDCFPLKALKYYKNTWRYLGREIIFTNDIKPDKLKKWGVHVIPTIITLL